MIGVSDDDFVELMDENGELRQDLKCPDNDVGSNLKDKINNDENILVCISFHFFQGLFMGAVTDFL